jgi:peptidoglycan/LPS O-acetylase OafA/YrhL
VAKKRSLNLWHPLILGLGCSMLVAAASQASDRLKRWSQLTPLPWMGQVSYSTYLWHMPVVICFMRTMRQLPEHGMFQSHAVAAGTVLLGIYLVSAVCYAHFEKPWIGKAPSPAKSRV